MNDTYNIKWPGELIIGDDRFWSDEEVDSLLPDEFIKELIVDPDPDPILPEELFEI